jgi:hypothetical protein
LSGHIPFLFSQNKRKIRKESLYTVIKGVEKYPA